MAVTKRKSFKKSVKKDVHSRKRNSKTRKHRKTIRNMKGCGIFGNLFRRKNKKNYKVEEPQPPSSKKENNIQPKKEKIHESIENYAQKFHAFFIDTEKNTGKKVDIMGEGNHPLAYYMTEYANRNLSKTTRTNLEKSHPKFEQEIYDFETIPKYKNLYLQAQKHAETLIQKFLTIHAQHRKIDRTDINILLPDINKLLLESLYHFITKYRRDVTSNTLHEKNIFEESGDENIKDTIEEHFR